MRQLCVFMLLTGGMGCGESKQAQPGPETGAGGQGGVGGWVAVGQGGDWTDRDECSDGSHQCHEKATCVDTADFYTCSCMPGYQGDGFQCEDVNECKTTQHDCSSQASCSNSEGSYACTCNGGFSGDGKTCRASYSQLTVGSFHSCALRADKKASCWGSNQKADGTTSFFMLGTTSAVDQLRPVEVAMDGWVELSAGFYTTCGRKEDNSLWCWGVRLGTVSGKSAEPLKLDDGSYTAISRGSASHMCAIATDGSLWCWGRNNTGQLGDGTTQTRQLPVEVSVAGGVGIAQIAVGYSHSCAITLAGELWCWGAGSRGQLGTGTTSLHTAPVRVGTASDWAEVALGYFHSCARKTTGDLFCWGENEHGQLGDGTDSDRLSPVAVDPGQLYATVAAGNAHSCGLRKSDGSLWCWGRGDDGQLGEPAVRSLAPRQVGTEVGWTALGLGWSHGCVLRGEEIHCWGSTLHGAVASGLSGKQWIPKLSNQPPAQSLAVSKTHACAVGQDGRLRCWGNNGDGELGVGDRQSRREPVEVSGGHTDWLSVAVGQESPSYSERHTCAIRGTNGSGSLWCWGANRWQQLGFDSQKADELVPVQIGTDSDWAQVQAGGTYTCARKVDQSLWCWGRGDGGQLGLGTLSWGKTPAQVLGGGSYAHLSLGQNASLAVRSDGTLWSWGKNTWGELGVGDKLSRNTPTQVGMDSDWASVSVGDAHACAVKTDGALYCWGGRLYGKLGLGPTTDVLVPTRVGLGSDWVSVSAGVFKSTCGVRQGTNTQQTLWCWGANNAGQLGTGDFDWRSVPVQVGAGSQWAQVDVGSEFACARLQNGDVRCWGSNSYGRTGLDDSWSDTPQRIVEP